MTDSILSVGFTQLWQLTLLIVVVGVLARTVARNRPHLAMVLWLLVLVKCVTPPMVAAPFGLFCRTVESQAEPAAAIDDAGPFAFFVKQEPDPVKVEAVTYVTEPIDVLVPIEEPIEPLTTRDWLVIAWAIGTALVVVVAFTRVLLCLYRINSTSVEPPKELVERLEELRSKLGIRRRVSLLITSSAIGPAVLGLFRLRVVVPEVIARDGADKLEPILAHELIHIRRGDLWFGLLNLIAKGLWWFHPLMWWVSKQIARDTERACDEDVLAALKCRPAEYARSLLRVLEQKNELKAMPAFPGVRPVEITSQRMERIMSLRQGSRSGGSWRRRLLFALAAAVVLPGAVISQEAKPLPAPVKKEEAKKQIVIKATVIRAPKGVFSTALKHDKNKEWKPKATKQDATAAPQGPGFGFSIESTDGRPAGRDTADLHAVSPEFGEKAKAVAITQIHTQKEWRSTFQTLQEHKSVDVLCAPKLICRDGQEAVCETMAEQAIRLAVTPTVVKDGISLKNSLSYQTVRGGEPVQKSSNKQHPPTIPDGLVYVQQFLDDETHDVALVLEVSELKTAPGGPINEAAALFGNQAVEAALADFDSQLSDTASGEEPVRYVIDAFIAEVDSEAPMTFPTPVPTQTVTLSQRLSDQAEPTVSRQAGYWIKRNSVPEWIRSLGKPDDVRILSRPKIMTLDGQAGRIQVGQSVPFVKKGTDPPEIEVGMRGIELSLTPTRKDHRVVLTGVLARLDDPNPADITELKGFEIRDGHAMLLRIKQRDSDKDLLLVLDAQVFHPDPVPKTVRVHVGGEVKAPGFFEVPIGDNNLLNAIAMAGGLTENAGANVQINRKVRVQAVVDGVAQASHEEHDGFVRVDLSKIVNGKVSPPLESEDRIVVPVRRNDEKSAAVPMFERSYGISGLTFARLTEPAPYKLEQVIRLVRGCVDEESWEHGAIIAVPSEGNSLDGDRKNADRYSSVIRVRQTIENHAKIKNWIDTLQAEVADGLRSIQTYSVAAIVDRSTKPVSTALDELASHIRNSIGPEKFGVGKNAIRSNVPTKSLVVRAHGETHQQVAKLLSKLRHSSRSDNAAVSKDPWNVGIRLTGAEFDSGQVKNYERRVKKARKVLEQARMESRHSVAQLERNLKSLELQLKAARTFVRPSVDQVKQRNWLQDLSDFSTATYEPPLLAGQSGNPTPTARSEGDWQDIKKTKGSNANRIQTIKHEQYAPVTYPIADLIVSHQRLSAADGSTTTEIDAEALAEVKARIRAIDPDSWRSAGGLRRLVFNEKTLSLVLRAPESAHSKVKALLDGLRREASKQVILELAIMERSDGDEIEALRPRLKKDAPKEVSLVAKEFQFQKSRRLMAPRLTLASGQSIHVSAGKLKVRCRAKIEDDSILVTVTIEGKATSWVIPEGRVGIADVTSAVRKALGEETDGKRYAITAKASVLTVEEEELILGKKVHSAAP